MPQSGPISLLKDVLSMPSLNKALWHHRMHYATQSLSPHRRHWILENTVTIISYLPSHHGRSSVPKRPINHPHLRPFVLVLLSLLSLKLAKSPHGRSLYHLPSIFSPLHHCKTTRTTPTYLQHRYLSITTQVPGLTHAQPLQILPR